MARLKDDWKFQFQLYGGWTFVNTGTFNTPEELWGGLEHIPNPSQLFRTREGPREAFLGEDRENVRGLILSRKDVVLEWEYPGLECIYEYEDEDIPGEAMDEIFEGYCVHAVSEQFPSLLGFRLLDRSKKDNVSHRWEFWCGAPDANLQGIIDEKNGKVKHIHT